jgi:SAM-dependent methyltransferase
LDTLPRQTPPESVLVVRSGYGALALVCRSRWKNSRITAFDRDLLAEAFTLRNDLKINGQGTLDFRLAPTLGEALKPEDAFDLVLMEVSPPAGEAVFLGEISEVSRILSPAGRALLIAPDKIARSWVQLVRPREGLNLRALASRAGFTVFELA